jgi:MerR family transcriptional regulator, copper efflux regulator
MMAIGKLAEKSGFAVSAIRYYEAEGLLPQALRQANGRRAYGPEAIETLAFISGCRTAGMGLDNVRALQDLIRSDAEACGPARDILEAALARVNSEISKLQKARLALSRLREACALEVCGPTAADCRAFAIAGGTQS